MSDFKKAYEYAESIFLKFSEKLIYHNFDHVKDVMNSGVRIAQMEGVSDEDIKLVKVAALYHDIGFIETYTGHERVSIDIATKKLKEFSFSDGEIVNISSMIAATELPQKPKSFLDNILCDADLDNFGRNDFFDIMDLLFIERNNFDIHMDKLEWAKITLKMLKNHDYFTESSKKLRNIGKEKNIMLLEKRFFD